jgi:hypothetical protein
MKIKLVIEIDCTSNLKKELVVPMLINNICESMPGVILNGEGDVLINSFEIYQEKGVK